MKSLKKIAALTLVLGLAAASAARAGTTPANIVQIGTDPAGETSISESPHWTADHQYRLVGQIYVLSGATLTIDAGTIVYSKASVRHWVEDNPATHAGHWVVDSAGDGGSLAICKGAKIYVNGTKASPVIMTSDRDIKGGTDDSGNTFAAWTGTVVDGSGNITTFGDPKTGAWHEGSSEWGNLTIMGKALISASTHGKPPVAVTITNADGSTYNNPSTPTGTAQNYMEGLTPDGATDQKTLYGGNDDNDNSGALHYLSLRYTGKVISLGNELNGLSMGGIGRATQVDHIDIVNAVDDGYETWGGTVNYKYMIVTNAGDDSMDVDEGWRGKAQFGLIVEGCSVKAARGSGVSDNCTEFDGAEDADAQPMTTATIYNFTYVGQPLSGHGGVALRDNARVQWRNCIWMDLGEELVGPDRTDGDQTHSPGYSYNNTLTWAQTWSSAFSEAWNTSNPATGGHANAGGLTTAQLQALYPVQTSGTLLEISDSVFFRNVKGAAGGGDAYAESNGVSVTTAGGSNPALHNVVAAYDGSSDAHMPIQALTRAATVTVFGRDVKRVISINPCAANDAVTSFAAAPADGFFAPARFRGAFGASNNWAKGWTAWDAYGYMAGPTASDPAAPAIAMVAGVSFQTVADTWYSVESSTDGVTWSPVATIRGDGTVMTVADPAPWISGKLYRATAQ